MCIQIVAFSFVEFGCSDVDPDIEISAMACDAIVAFAGKLDVGAVLDSSWDFNIYHFSCFFESIFEFFAIFGKGFACSSAMRACSLGLHDAKRCVSLLSDYSTSMTGVTRFFGGSFDFGESIVSYFFACS